MFKKQITFLFFLILVGFILICSTALIFLNALKYEHDLASDIYKKRIGFLDNVEYFYTSSAILDSIKLKQQYDEMIENWDLYKNFGTSDSFLIRLKLLYRDLFLKDEKILLENLEPNMQYAIEEIDSLIGQTKIILYDLEFSEYNAPIVLLRHSLLINNKIGYLILLQNMALTSYKKIADSIYRFSMFVLFVFMIIVVWFILLFLKLRLSSMREINVKLKKTITEQTIKLRESNKDLQKIIDYEISQSRKKDMIMYQQARFAAMGEMIQNIAHQWRQPLNSLMIIIQSFKLKFDNNKMTQEFIDSQTKDAMRIANNMSSTIENFRNFFQQNSHKESFSLNKSIMDSIKIVEPILKQSEVKIFFEECENIEMYGYENAFSQILLNLLKNSLDVLNNLEPHNRVIQIVLESNDENILISFMDSGGGTKCDIEKIFEPYYTTKHKSVGTGIGLYMVKQIVEKQMNGSIEVKNKEWNLSSEARYYGAVFMIKFNHSLNLNRQEDK